MRDKSHASGVYQSTCLAFCLRRKLFNRLFLLLFKHILMNHVVSTGGVLTIMMS